MRKLLKLSSLQFLSWKNAKKQRKYLKNWSKLRFALQLVLRENFQKRWCRGKSNLSKRPLSRKQKVERPSKLNSKVLTESSKVRKKSFLARSRKFLHFRFWPKKLFFLTLEASVSTFDNKFVAHFTFEKLEKEVFERPAPTSKKDLLEAFFWKWNGPPTWTQKCSQRALKWEKKVFWLDRENFCIFDFEPKNFFFLL